MKTRLALALLAIVIASDSTLLRAADTASSAATSALKTVFKDSFLVGVAINENQFSGKDPRALPIIQSQFNSITPENILKWESVHPEPDRYNFAPADRYVAFGETN